MSRIKRQRGGFTLLELLFVVAIIGVLSTTAIGMIQRQQQRAKRSEAMTNLAGLAKMLRGYYGENGLYPFAPSVPLGLPGDKQNWDAASTAAFGPIGFSIAGAVYYVYDVSTPAGLCGTCGSNDCFTATAYGDSDKDGGTAVIAYYHSDGSGGWCDTGVLAIGPQIDPFDGQPIFEQPVDVFQYSGPIVDDF